MSTRPTHGRRRPARIGVGCGKPPPRVGSTARSGPVPAPPPSRPRPGARPAAEGGPERGRENRREGGKTGEREGRPEAEREDRGGSPAPPAAPHLSDQRRLRAGLGPGPGPGPLRRPPMARPLPLLLCLAVLGAGCRAESPPTGTAGPSAEPLQDEADNQENILSQVSTGDAGHLGGCWTTQRVLGTHGAGLCAPREVLLCAAVPSRGMLCTPSVILDVHARWC